MQSSQEDPLQATVHTLLSHHAYGDALFLAERAYYDGGQDPERLHLLALCHVRKGDKVQAFELLKTASLGAPPPSPKVRYLMGVVGLELGKLQEAEVALISGTGSALDYVEKVYPQDLSPFVYKLFGEICLQTDRQALASSSFTRALKLNPFLFSCYEASSGESSSSSSCEKIFSLKNLQDAAVASIVGWGSGGSGGLCPEKDKLPEEKTSKGVLMTRNSNSTRRILTSTPNNQEVLQEEEPSSLSSPQPPSESPIITTKEEEPKAKKPCLRAVSSSSSNNSPSTTTSSSWQQSSTQQQSASNSNNNNGASRRRSSRLFPNNNNTPSTSAVVPGGVGAAVVTLKENSQSQGQQHQKQKAPQQQQQSSSSLRSTLESVLVKNYVPLASSLRSLQNYNCRKALETLTTQLKPCQQNSPYALALLGRAHFELGEFEQAVKHFETLRITNKYDSSLAYLSSSLWHLGRETDLSQLSQQFLSEPCNKSNPATWICLGNTFSLQKEHEVGGRFFKRAIQTALPKDSYYAHVLLAHEYIAIEELDKALRCFRTASRLNASSYNAFYGLGMIYYKQERFEEALYYYQKSCRINKENAVLKCHLGLCLSALGRVEDSLKTFEEAAVICHGNEALVKFHKSSVLFGVGRFDEALVLLEELKGVCPRESLVHFLSAKIHSKRGETHKALLHFSWATDLDPRGLNSQIKEPVLHQNTSNSSIAE